MSRIAQNSAFAPDQTGKETPKFHGPDLINASPASGVVAGKVAEIGRAGNHAFRYKSKAIGDGVDSVCVVDS